MNMKFNFKKFKLKNTIIKNPTCSQFFAVFFLILVIFYTLGLIYMAINNRDKEEKIEQEEIISFKEKELSILDSVYSYIFELRLEHPKIVIAQCIEESGWFEGKIFKEANNCLGMKVPYNRPTLVKGVLYGHGKFNSWKDCLCDYAIWQSIYARGKTENEYFSYLDRVYAEKKGYSDRLKKIIKDNNL